VKVRGRWRSEASVKRYGKAARSLAEAEKVPPVILRYGLQVKAAIGNYFRGLGPLPQCPVALA